jgi:hypothetical protein
MLTTEGGYGGTLSQWGGVNTQIGYIFPDILQGKVFGLVMGKGGPYLKELSQDGLMTFMHQQLPIGLVLDASGNVDMTNVTTANSYLIDNPFEGIGIMAGYDYKLRRSWLIKHPNALVSDPGFCLSYSTITNKWFSFHDYFPNSIIPYDNRVLFMRNIDENGNPLATAEFWEMNEGNKGEFFGTIYPSVLESVSAKAGTAAKTYQNFRIFSESNDPATGIKIRDDNFDTMQIFNDRMNTGVYDLVHGNTFLPTKNPGETFIKYRNDEYRVAIPRDAVIDNAGDIFDLVNLDQNVALAERIKGDYAQYRFVYDNLEGREFILKFISTIFNNNVR